MSKGTNWITDIVQKVMIPQSLHSRMRSFIIIIMFCHRLVLILYFMRSYFETFI